MITMTEQDLKESNKGKETQIKQKLILCLELSYLAILTINTNLLKFIAWLKETLSYLIIFNEQSPQNTQRKI
jgi:hypothetical protein